MTRSHHLAAAFSVTPCRRLARAPSVSRRYARVLIQAPSLLHEGGPSSGSAPGSSGRPPVHVAFILDRSGSMMGEKLALAREAVDHALGQLRAGDRFAIVVFDDTVQTLVPVTEASPEAIRDARTALGRVESGRSTNISDAWIEGCQQIAAGAGSGSVGSVGPDGTRSVGSVGPDGTRSVGAIVRALLLTDGQANAGLKRAREFAPHVAALRDAGVSTTCFGLGLDFDEEYLATVARAGSGNFHFIREAGLIPEFIARELGESLTIVCRRPSLHVEVDVDTSVKPISDFPARRPGPGHLEVPLPDLCSGQSLEVMLAFDLPARALGARSAVKVTLVDEDGCFAACPSVSFDFLAAPHLENDAQPRDADVDRAVARIYAARAEREAIRHNRRHAFDEAREVLGATARRIAHYAGQDPELTGIVTGLYAAADRYGVPLDELHRKTRHAGTIFITRSRDADGLSRKS